MSDMIERVARAIAKDNGDDFDAIPQDKQDWIANHSSTGRFRDVNEPRRDDYISMARAAIEAMREPTPEMSAALEYQLPLWVQEIGTNEDVYYAAIDAALSQDTHSLPTAPEAATNPPIESCKASAGQPAGVTPSVPAGTNSGDTP